MTFQGSALLSGLQKIIKKLKSLDNDLYAMRAEKNKRSRREYKSPGRQILEIETGLETILETVLKIYKTEIEGCQEGL